VRGFSRPSVWLLLLAAMGIPITLLWDFSWESTVGIDLVWAPPHTANYLVVALAGFTGLGMVAETTRSIAQRAGAVRCGRLHAPLGAWLVIWGALAFAGAFLFDRWWQWTYGLAAGLWHPPQIFKAIAFFALVAGAGLVCLKWQNQASLENGLRAPVGFAAWGGSLLAMISVVTLTSIYPNRQHSASFYNLVCGTYPIVLMALASAGKLRWTATIASMVYSLVFCLMVWLLPLFPASPQVAPIYNPLDHLMPPPFPLLLLVPAVALDALIRLFPWPAHWVRPWLQAGAAGLVFFILFIGTHWIFAEFLLTDLAENWFFAGGGRHWPFFLKIDDMARVGFWDDGTNEMTLMRALFAAGLAMVAARVGLWLGAWMARLRR
jgi:hypothetical protein